MKPRRRSDPALILAARIYAFKNEGEAWTTAVDRYARDVLYRHPRTVHRWLSGESPLPQVVADSLMPRATATSGFLVNAGGTGILQSGDGSPGLPYPWCRDPETCAGKGCCPRDPNCGE